MCHAEASMDPSLYIHIAFASLAFDVGATQQLQWAALLLQSGKIMASPATTEATIDA